MYIFKFIALGGDDGREIKDPAACPMSRSSIGNNFTQSDVVSAKTSPAAGDE